MHDANKPYRSFDVYNLGRYERQWWQMERLKAETNLTIRLKYIPREIMEPNRAEVQFFEAGALQAKIIQNVMARGATQSPRREKEIASAQKARLAMTERAAEFDVELVNFIPSLAEAPEDELDALRKRAVKSPFDFIDFWAVDFDYRANKPFEHHWQDFRTRKDRSLKTKTDIGWKYDANEKRSRGKKKICVKVIDVFGVDTTTVLEVDA